MSTDHYTEAIGRLFFAVDARTNGFSDDASQLLQFAQVYATLAVVDAIRDLASKACVCGHNADVHDERVGDCLTDLDDGRPCYCTEFKARS